MGAGMRFSMRGVGVMSAMAVLALGVAACGSGGQKTVTTDHRYLVQLPGGVRNVVVRSVCHRVEVHGRSERGCRRRSTTDTSIGGPDAGKLPVCPRHPKIPCTVVPIPPTSSQWGSLVARYPGEFALRFLVPKGSTVLTGAAVANRLGISTYQTYSRSGFEVYVAGYRDGVSLQWNRTPTSWAQEFRSWGIPVKHVGMRSFSYLPNRRYKGARGFMRGDVVCIQQVGGQDPYRMCLRRVSGAMVSVQAPTVAEAMRIAHSITGRITLSRR